MSSGVYQKRTRSERVAALEMPPGPFGRVWLALSRWHLLARMGMNLLAAVLLCVVFQGWNPPFAYRTKYVPPSDIVATVSFSKPDLTETKNAQELAQSRVRSVYVLNSEPLVKLRALLRNTVADITSAATLDDVEPSKWNAFEPYRMPGADEPSPIEQAEAFERFRSALAGPEKLAQFDKAVEAALAPFERQGLLDKLSRERGKGNYEEIVVYEAGSPTKKPQIVKLADVLIGDGKIIHRSLVEQLHSPEVADRVFAWLHKRLPQRTLAIDEVETNRALEEAAASVGVSYVQCQAGEVLALAGKSIDNRQLAVLYLEHEAAMAQRPLEARLARAVAVIAAVFALFLLCGMYIRYREYGIVYNLRQFAVLLCAACLTVVASYWLSADRFRAELIPLLIFGTITAIAYCQELAVVVTGVLAAIVTMGTGLGLGQVLLYCGVGITVVLQVGQIRSRAKLIHVGLISGAVAFVLSVVMSVLNDQPIWPVVSALGPFWRVNDVLTEAGRQALCVMATGFLMTGLLPFVENVFGVLTDLSLLELGDVAHPLLQELVRRAPATYNHSITVGSIAEAAADAIGARGLLVRVGAYFHDIGKMLKPGYFVENQGTEGNLHDGLVPAMSTLVIIAHIKDGADLGRQRHLPRPIIDLISQHHGTTLVEYFYDRAQQQSEGDPNGAEVDESAYRYPGPKPQTKEAGVLMLADAVESACRSLVDPTPARIEGLVRSIAEKRLHDGQFDESGLTLRELRSIEKTLIKSLTALYHGRIKYPEQKTA
jgi:cyclic-di-AMP phosphodiesterase PgpH